MSEEAKDTAISIGQNLFKAFFTDHGNKITNIINKQCSLDLNITNLSSVADFTIARYNESQKKQFSDFQNGVGPFVDVDTLQDDQKTFFNADLTVKTIPATAFNDLYKWTMMPVIREMELKKAGGDKEKQNNSCLVTFGVDLRDQTMLGKIQTDEKLRENIFNALKGLKERTFDETHFNNCLEIAGKGLILDAKKANITERPLVDGKVLYNGTESPDSYKNNLSLGEINEWRKADTWNDKLDVNKVNIHFFTKKSSDDTTQIFIEATGPWHKVTWLETSMMQCVYETVLRQQLAQAKVPYNVWLCDALLRTAMSIALTKDNDEIKTMKGALFTGRRTGGFLFLILQNLMYETHFSQFVPIRNGGGNSLGSSSCDALLILNDLRYRKKEFPIQPAGTHAHELSMVNSALYPYLDLIVPGATQIIGHYLYYKLSMKPFIDERSSAGPIPALPDTIGTNVFLNAAKTIIIKDEEIKDEDDKAFLKSFFDLFNDKETASAFRQDSGELKTFKERVTKCGYNNDNNKHGMMASEIEVVESLFKAKENGYKYFGAGGFYGDSAKVWTHPNAASNSMAVKAIRVLTSGNNYAIYKTGDLDTTKFISNCNIEAPAATELIKQYNEQDVENIFAFPIKTGDKEYDKECEVSTKLAIDHNTSDLTKQLKILQAQSIQKKYNDAMKNNCTGVTIKFLDIDEMVIETWDEMVRKTRDDIAKIIDDGKTGGKRRRTRKRSKRTKRRSQLKKKRSHRKRTHRNRR